MNSTTHVEDSNAPQSVDKGKRRAAEDPTERTPLLASSSSTLDDDPPPTVVRRRLRSKLTAVFLGTLVVSVLGCVAAALLAWSYASRASHISADDILDQGLVFEGPDRVDVLNITWSGGLWVNVEARVGFDAGSVIGVNSSPDGDGLLKDLWKSIGRWGVRSLDRVSVNMSTIYLTSESGVVLATIEPTPVVVPLTANPPSDSTWLTHISTPLLIRPTHNVSALIHFVREAWRDGSAAVRADVGSVEVRGGRPRGGQLEEYPPQRPLQLPPIPGIPRTDPAPPLSELVTLQSFSVRSSSGSLVLAARATLPDPAPVSFNLTCPSLPFTISLPPPTGGDAPPIPIAAVSTAPFALTHPNITLHISGHVLPLPLPPSSSASLATDAGADALPALSAFLTRYLSGLPQPHPRLPHHPKPGPHPPPRLPRALPAPARPAQRKGGLQRKGFTASGTVYARVVLPPGMEVGLHVGRVLPDVLVFDGEVPEDADLPAPFLPPSHLDEDEDESSPFPSFPVPVPSFPLPGPFPGLPLPLPRPRPREGGDADPAPLPARAFGHIRPTDWLVGAAFAVTAKIVEVPLEVLPGREREEFADFVGKVVFGTGGAVAGILGVASVAVDVFGLTIPGDGDGSSGEMELHGLPFRGSVLVGKKVLFDADAGTPRAS
ncbi:hypothetical protein B0H14DRAFT_3736429 [Mycena olivaceomarginata]|nr:hypothetical protein B0H14DRAFT_3736429 [Mycena olivaceomarginata]